MDRCSPVEMRKNLEVVEQFKKAGVDFVAMPARDQEHKKELIEQAYKILDEEAIDE
jgi:TRAP-type C4-dicarboxylate transport system substrate-binding protein